MTQQWKRKAAVQKHGHRVTEQKRVGVRSYRCVHLLLLLLLLMLMLLLLANVLNNRCSYALLLPAGREPGRGQ